MTAGEVERATPIVAPRLVDGLVEHESFSIEGDAALEDISAIGTDQIVPFALATFRAAGTVVDDDFFEDD